VTGSKFTRTEHTYNLGLKYNLSDRTRIGYDLYYDFREENSTFGGMRRFTQVSNSVSLNRKFSDVFTGNVRLQKSHSDDSLGGAVENMFAYNVSIRAAYLASFTQTLSLISSRTDLTGDSGPVTDTHLASILLRNIFQLYTGWNAGFDIGYSRQTDDLTAGHPYYESEHGYPAERQNHFQSELQRHLDERFQGRRRITNSHPGLQCRHVNCSGKIHVVLR
jgi:hypothetical protein